MAKNASTRTPSAVLEKDSLAAVAAPEDPRATPTRGDLARSAARAPWRKPRAAERASEDIQTQNALQYLLFHWLHEKFHTKQARQYPRIRSQGSGPRQWTP